MQANHLVVLAEVLSDLRVAMLVVGHDYVARLGRRNTSLAIELSRQVALPVLLVLAHVLNAERVAVMDKQRLTALA